MASKITGTEKQKIEQEFHDRWAKGMDVSSLLVREAFEKPTAMENRFAFDSLAPVEGKKLLDLGCGAGETSVYFALRGADVTALDISPEMIEVAKRLADLHKVKLKLHTGVAEKLPFKDGEFDIVFCNGVLHHVDLIPALKEVRRVLRPGGRAAFIEPLKHNPVIGLYRHLAADNRTPTEFPLGVDDFARIQTVFPKLAHREFWFFTLYLFIHFFLIERASPGKVRYWKKVIEDADRYEGMFRRLKWLDDKLLSLVPWLGRYCWNTVLVADKEA